MYCHDTTKISTPTASLGSPSQSCLSSPIPRPAPIPKLGSSSALYVIEMAAEDSSRGTKYSTASSPRYFLNAARKTPIRMDSGVCTSHEMAMISNVTHSACGSSGSDNSPPQLVGPDAWMAPRPSQVVKLSASTPSSGTRPKARNINSAGSAIQATPLRPPLTVDVLDAFTRTAGGASDVIGR